MGVTYAHALASCIQHYMDRGYSLEQAIEYLTVEDKNDIFRVYDIIQEEKKKPVTTAMTDLLQKR